MPLPFLHRNWAHPRHICTETALSAPDLAAPPIASAPLSAAPHWPARRCPQAPLTRVSTGGWQRWRRRSSRSFGRRTNASFARCSRRISCRRALLAADNARLPSLAVASARASGFGSGATNRGLVWSRVGLSHRSGRPFRKASRSSRLILPPSLSATHMARKRAAPPPRPLSSSPSLPASLRLRCSERVSGWRMLRSVRVIGRPAGGGQHVPDGRGVRDASRRRRVAGCTQGSCGHPRRSAPQPRSLAKLNVAQLRANLCAVLTTAAPGVAIRA